VFAPVKLATAANVLDRPDSPQIANSTLDLIGNTFLVSIGSGKNNSCYFTGRGERYLSTVLFDKFNKGGNQL
jgi:hypothetical protein